ncbi:hypothetical protein [Pseudomonas simiae]|nr:hypothetical protein [Pseudomonas simiae]
MKKIDSLLKSRGLYIQQDNKAEIQKEQIARFIENQQERNAKKDS